MSRFVILSMIVGAVASTTGCASARYVSKQPDSGVIAIPSNSNTWPFHYRQEAEELIRQHIGPDFEIVDERQVVTGVQVTSNQQTQRDPVQNKKQPNLPGERVTTTDTTTTRNLTEWHITYCRRGATVVTSVAPHGEVNGPSSGVQPAVIVVPQGQPALRQPY